MTEPPAELRKPSLWELALVFATISLTSFGGGQKAQIRRQLVSDKHWITEAEFIEGLEVAELLPGPNVLNLAVFMGQRIHGTLGGLVSLVAASFPPFLIVLAAGAFYFSPYNGSVVHAALMGAAAAAAGLTLGNAVELTIEPKRNWLDYAFIAATAVAVSAFHLSLVYALAVFGGLSMYIYYRRHRATAEKSA